LEAVLVPCAAERVERVPADLAEEVRGLRARVRDEVVPEDSEEDATVLSAFLLSDGLLSDGVVTSETFAAFDSSTVTGSFAPAAPA
jgi:hypothetical protein